MPVNKRSKYRGSRTCGGGTHKNRRGAGNRGGRGNAGVNAHHFVRAYLVRGPVFGKNGFKHHHEASITGDVLDIGEIDQIVPILLQTGFAEEEGDTVIVDAAVLGVEKVLGGGKVTHKMNITAVAFSQRAIAKIEAKGGHALTS
ncbi:MAG TPA: uL15m family ribosomal protein [Methanospirillum sp.]|nr:uL15m family ribosomal protein [Methanospirillum sp.]